MKTRLFALLMGCHLAIATTGFAWGREGHRIVARIAAKNLDAATRNRIIAILGVGPSGLEAAMADAATWPDSIDKEATGTSRWHFVDVPTTAPFSLGSLCAGHQCVIDRIQEMADRLSTNATGFALLQRPNPPRPMTSQELAFLIHLVGDVHQPLHAANNADRGGNCEALASPIVHPSGGRDTTELHALWDVDTVLTVMKGFGSESQTANALFQRFKSGEAVPQLSALDWARESNALAARDIYQQLGIPSHSARSGQCAAGIAKVNVTRVYLERNAHDVETQLMRAGIRLSRMLNSICMSGCAANPGRGGR